MNNEQLDFLIAKKNLRETKFEQKPLTQKADLKPNEILLKVKNFALTANNITYAALGDKFSYWQFFPTGEEDWGQLPVWGFADILYSNNADVKEGESLFGYLPTASHCRMLPEKASLRGFNDGSGHRRNLPQVYNHYVLSSGNPNYKKENEGKEMIFRPLFMTSFFLDDYLFDNDYLGARQIVIVSASSKTAISLAYLLNKNRRAQYEIVGLTAKSNADFVKSLGCYDRVIEYGAIDEIDASQPTAFVDWAGNQKILAAAHHHFKDNLKVSFSAGASHWEDLGNAEALPGPKPEVFFAPTQIKKRSAEWGQGGIEEKFGEVWPQFLSWLDGWFAIENFYGVSGLTEAYNKVLEGKAPPERGFVINF